MDPLGSEAPDLSKVKYKGIDDPGIDGVRKFSPSTNEVVTFDFRLQPI